jgi:nucleolar MIF4G domain-containing protein 1
MESLPEQDGQGRTSKEALNTMLLLVHMYNFEIVHCGFLYDIIKMLVERFTEPDIEVLLTVLRHAGFQLRKDDPAALRDIVLLVDQKVKKLADAKKADAAVAGGGGSTMTKGRVSFMLDMIHDIKNNRKRSHEDNDLEVGTRMRKWLTNYKNKLKTSVNPQCFRISWAELHQTGNKGRWWVVGAAWTGRPTKGGDVEVEGEENENDALLKLASKQRMNTDVRRSIFPYTIHYTHYTPYTILTACHSGRSSVSSAAPMITSTALRSCCACH